MSIKKEKIPIVRFRDFSEPWLKNQLSEVADFSKGRGYSKKDLQSHGTPIILYGRLYTNYESAISNVETCANLEENSVVSEGGEVIIPASGESADDISRASCVIDRGIILGGDLNIVRPHEYLNSLFIAITLSNGSQQRELSKRAQGKSVVHLHNSDLKVVKLFYPSYEEQSAIGSLFRTLDDLLTSYKDNLANYRSLKSTMLSKMFPKAGQTVPEIRLDGFEGEWKFIKLGEAILEAYQGINTASDKVEYSISGIPILQAKHITNGQINYRDTRYLDMEIYEHYISKYMPKKGEILFANIGTIGPSVLVDSDKMFLIAWNILKISIKDNYSPVFIKIILSLLDSKHIFERITTGNATKFINKDEIMDIRISVPSLEEQQAIGAYFSNLDNLIAAHQEKIMQLETLKKKLLQDMFI
ncbi:restriction endonuclease subunit S [Streptococcus gordonii]|uniref:restriction endonuclease subunit S n=1 Tax=Streptococcus gordonii TaxID=1302 RepID=UPI002285324B|nr:restriction endonuclease subunit S [Streptococcus gordonii]MCY7138570.1 restriction endonuclease subunit S [Streptococcus gordonii]